MPYDNTIIGWMPENDLKALEGLSKHVPENGTIVEVGSYMGRSSVCWAMSAPTSKVVCIDVFYDFEIPSTVNIPDEVAEQHFNPKYNHYYNIYREFLKNTQNFKNIIPMQGACPEVTYNDGEIDLLFLDATHSNPSDWEILTDLVPKVKVGGIVSGHDYGHQFPNVVQNVYRLEQILKKPRTLHFETSVWSFKIDRKISMQEMLNLQHQP